MRLSLLIAIALIGYGSLYPFNFSEFQWSLFEFIQNEQSWNIRTSRGDRLGNVLLFLPLGLMMGFPIKQPSSKLWKQLILPLLFGLIFAVLLQYLQQALPTRVASMDDVLYNGLGLIIGIIAVVVIQNSKVQAYFNYTPSYVLFVAFGMMTCWLCFLWFPFVPSLDWTLIEKSFRRFNAFDGLALILLIDKIIAWCTFWYFAEKFSPKMHSLALKIWVFIGVAFIEVIIVKSVMSWQGWLGAMIAALLMTQVRNISTHQLALILLGWILIKYTGLSSLDVNSVWHWVPFEMFLNGSYWYHSFYLFEQLFFMGSVFFLLQQNKQHWLLNSFILAGVITVTEVLRFTIFYQSAGVTNPILAWIIAITMSQLKNSEEKRLQYV